MKTKALTSSSLTSDRTGFLGLVPGFFGGWAALLILGWVLASGGRAGAEPFKYISQAVSKVAAAGTLMNLGDYDFVSGNSLFGCYLRNGKSMSLRTDFEKGKRYFIIGGGDEDIEDLDIRVESDGGGLIGEDVKEDATPIVSFTPKRSERYTVKITNQKSQIAGFCAFVIMVESEGSKLALRQLTEALGNAMEHSRVAGNFANSFAEGCFCLFGGHLSADAECGLYDTSFEDAKFVMVSAGSDGLADVDSFIYRQARRGNSDGTEVDSDTDPDAHPVCEFNADSERYYYLKHKNASSKGGFVFSSVLKIR